MKFLADMGISPKSVAFLKKAGHDAIHLCDQDLERLPDSKVLEKSKIENRILLTHDLDFGELVAASKDNLPSVVIFRLRNMHPLNVNAYIDKIITHHKKALEEGAVISVSETQIRERLIPIK